MARIRITYSENKSKKILFALQIIKENNSNMTMEELGIFAKSFIFDEKDIVYEIPDEKIDFVLSLMAIHEIICHIER